MTECPIWSGPEHLRIIGHRCRRERDQRRRRRGRCGDDRDSDRFGRCAGRERNRLVEGRKKWTRGRRGLAARRVDRRTEVDGHGLIESSSRIPPCGRQFRCGLLLRQRQRNRERTFFLVHRLTRRGDEQKPFRRSHRTRAQKRAAFEQLDLDSAATPWPVMRMIGHPCPPSVERLGWSVGSHWICRRDRPLLRRSPRRRTATSTPPRGVSASGQAWPHSRGRSGGPSPSQRAYSSWPPAAKPQAEVRREPLFDHLVMPGLLPRSPSVSRRSQNQSPTGPFDQHFWVRRRFFHCQPPATIPTAIKPRTDELGSGTEIAPNRPSVLLSSPAVKKSVSAEPAPAPLPNLSMRSRQAPTAWNEPRRSGQDLRATFQSLTLRK